MLGGFTDNDAATGAVIGFAYAPDKEDFEPSNLVPDQKCDIRLLTT